MGASTEVGRSYGESDRSGALVKTFVPNRDGEIS